MQRRCIILSLRDDITLIRDAMLKLNFDVSSTHVSTAVLDMVKQGPDIVIIESSLPRTSGYDMAWMMVQADIVPPQTRIFILCDEIAQTPREQPTKEIGFLFRPFTEQTARAQLHTKGVI